MTSEEISQKLQARRATIVAELSTPNPELRTPNSELRTPNFELRTEPEHEPRTENQEA